jgi:hypothetical protein
VASVAAVGSAAALFLLPMVLHPSGAVFSTGAEFTDLLVAHLPGAWFLHRALAIWHTVPLWNPTILSGIPFAADPLSGLWYPPLWLAAVWPEPLTFNLLTLVHLAWGGFGMMVLLRGFGLDRVPALVGAFAFMGAPKIIGHIGLGHIGLVYAVSWTPWLLAAARSLADNLVEARRSAARSAARAGGLLALIFLIDPRWSIPSAVVALLFGLACWLSATRGARRDLPRLSGGLANAGLFAIGLSAGLAWPLIEWLQLSTRAGLGTASSTLPLPAARLVGLLVPQYGAWAEWMVSAGVVVLVLAGVGLVERGRQGLLWAGLIIGGWVLALGDTTLVGAVLGRIPGWNLVRVPPRWLFVSGLGLSVLCAFGVDAVLALRSAGGTKRLSRLLALGLAASVSAFGAALFFARPEGAPTGFVLLVAPALSIGAFLLVVLSPRLPTAVSGALLAGLILIDLTAIDRTLLDVRERDTASDEQAWLQYASDGSRVFSPSYAIPQDEAARLGLELADGVHPLQLRSYVEWMAAATGFEADAYSVTLPPFPTGDPKEDWGPRLDPERLGKLAVGYVVSDYPLSASGWEMTRAGDGLFVYRNPQARPRAWVESGDGPWRPAQSIDRQPNRIVILAEGPGRLVLSEIAYPGWRVIVDGRRSPMETVDGLLRGVELAAGLHEVRFEFRPSTVFAGLSLTLVSLAALVYLSRRTP